MSPGIENANLETDPSLSGGFCPVLVLVNVLILIIDVLPRRGIFLSIINEGMTFGIVSSIPFLSSPLRRPEHYLLLVATDGESLSEIDHDFI